MSYSIESSVRQEKLDRIANGQKPRVLDLFAGCGGFSLGFQAAGFHIAGGVELDPHAARTHAMNFHRSSHENLFEQHALPRDIVETDPIQLSQELEWRTTKTAIDVMIGGPPCQSYARVGRAKLREVAEHPEAFLRDSRGNLYLRYLEYVKAFQPLAVIVENVPDALNYGGHNIAEEMCEVLTSMNYTARYTLLNAVFYGVPQMRERMFIVAYANELMAHVNFPQPTHWINLPAGYKGSRNVALKALRNTTLFADEESYFLHWPEATPELPKAVSALEATKDLPKITLHKEGKLKRGARRLDTLIKYQKNGRLNEYAALMRSWPGYESKDGIYDHVIRYLPRDYAIFARMSPGDQYPEAYELANRMFSEKLADLQKEGVRLKEGEPRYEELKKETVPVYDPKKFPNKWRKMEPDAPARTLMAHLGKDSYSHIHYDSGQERTISVREAARLQSFPDGFRFSGTMNPAFRQIGNAVPPLLAKAIGREVMYALKLKNLNNDQACLEEVEEI